MATEDTPPSPEPSKPKKPRNKKKLLLFAAAPLGVLLLAVVGFFVYQFVAEQFKQKQVDLEKFGFDLHGTSQYETSEGLLGEAQLPSTFADENLTPSERIVHSLVRDRENLIIENRTLRQQIEALEAQLETYEEDRRMAEYFMPENFSQELERVERMLHTYLRQSADAQRFSNFRLEIMAAAGRMEYQRFVEANQLMLDAVQRTEIVVDYLPAFMFCVGDAVQLAANDFSEEREIRDYFGNPEQHRLPTIVQEDLDVVLPPCQRELREALNTNMANLL
ncbi:hypothetical protein [Nitrincola iocasae]|uniref:Uncharacterized protein n=1 Tax=Nitrincola iocasae TaxID=2614693 RepID=A0A5J6LFG4_9GAMM|nr:hypothetical protein [Nitrincola iocasae]QEW07304.1 hypothetical protein F5I99_12780 [Nitrincola iocasae]